MKEYNMFKKWKTPCSKNIISPQINESMDFKQ